MSWHQACVPQCKVLAPLALASQKPLLDTPQPRMSAHISTGPRGDRVALLKALSTHPLLPNWQLHLCLCPYGQRPLFPRLQHRTSAQKALINVLNRIDVDRESAKVTMARLQKTGLWEAWWNLILGTLQDQP